MSEEPRRMSDAGVEVRATHPAGFRSGEWAVVTGLEWANDRACYRVRFPDGATDSWVVNDPSDPYEFRAALSSPETTPAGVLDEAALREVLTAVRGILDQHVLRLIRYYDLRQTHIETFTFEAIAEIDAALAAQPQPGEPTP